MNINYLYIVILFLFISVFIVNKLNKYLVFQPYIPSEEEYENMICDEKIKKDNLMISTRSNRNINVIFLNKNDNKNKNVILYAHGNYGWCGSVITTKIIDILLDYGTVVIFDYAGYGFSEGTSSESNTYEDIYTVYEYINLKKQINSDNIIIYGFSLGTAISSHLVSLCDNKNSPKLLILDSPYISIKEIAHDINPLLKYLTIIGYDNKKNIDKIIEKKINTKIIILHSIDDEIINYRHGKELSEHFSIKLYTLSGTHNEPSYGEIFREIFT